MGDPGLSPRSSFWKLDVEVPHQNFSFGNGLVTIGSTGGL
jgi:hypothetical protein